MGRPLLLDLFCGAGGCSEGYRRAGFDVVGVDIDPQPRYPFDLVRADAMSFPLDGFDAIHASPPCQDHSSLRSLAGDHGTGWMLLATIERLRASGLPWVVENVATAAVPEWPNVVQLCGSMFGLGVRRHRIFATSWFMLAPGCHHKRGDRQPVGVYGVGGGGSMTRGYKGTLTESREAMGIDWMNRAEISQAIPPAYTEWIGERLSGHL